ncbi:hypothetical protein [Jiangella asiatica]|uniref:Uncharacterized protein n=1 Tax=Jiangella asiatica TaxID=2530372 RepID=A0A4V2Z2Q1_9ACTN|nr:hypothetical protein [Jiangella asiatica]TDE09718.1 hypothetical protein E1269_13950 [Jiangella asiatica]
MTDAFLPCGEGRRVRGHERVCVGRAGHRPPHRDYMGVEWITEGEILGTPLADFDSYADEHGIPPERLAEAFAHWLDGFRARHHDDA